MKGLPKFAVSKPVTTMMIYLAVLLLGLICVKRLPQELFPPITYPVLSVVTNYANAAPEEIESLVTKLIEEAIGTAKGIKRISSQSREGVSIITVEFSWGTDIDKSSLELSQKIDLVKEQLPRDSEEPLVLKFNPYEKPILVFSVTGTLPQEDLLRYSRKVIKDKLEKLDGVASASISGGLERQILVEIDKGRLAATKIDILSVSDAISNSNLNYPAGTTKEKFYEYLIRTIGEYETIDDVRNTVVSLDLIKKEDEEEKKQNRRDDIDKRRELKTTTKYKPMILLSDVALVRDDFKEKTSHSRYNGKANISIAIQKQADANTIKTANLVLDQMKVIEQALPKGMNVEIVYNQGVFIKNSIVSVANAAWQGGVLAFIVLLFFLKDVRKSVVVATTIPLCLLITLICMYFMGISLNMLSMGGLAMGIGMLVDAGIVVVENISRHTNTLKEEARKASIDGASEVSSAVFSSTLTSVAVFLPMVFIIGIAGQLFRELALTVTFILIASYMVAITWIPRLTMKAKPEKEHSSKFFKGADIMLTTINTYYSRILDWFLANRKKGMLYVAMIFFSSLFIFPLIEKEVLPKVDQGQITINITMLTGTRLEITNKTVRAIETLILEQKVVKNVNVSVGSSRDSSGSGSVETLGSHQGRILVNLKKKRDMTSSDFIALLRNKVEQLGIPSTTDVGYVATESDFVMGEATGDAAVELLGLDYPILKGLIQQIEEEVRTYPEVVYVKNSLSQPSPETKINIRKDKAALYNLSTKDISETALLCIRGIVSSKFKEEGNEYDILVRLQEEDRNSVSGLRGIYIYSSQLDQPVPLNELATLTFGKGPSRIDRKERQRVITVSVDKTKDASKKELVEKINTFISTLTLPDNYTVKMGGDAEEVKRSFQSVIFAIILSIILIYMIMASQFESLLQPFIIMFTVPLSLIGVALTLILTGTALSVMALLGVIILGGLIVNNGIVLIQYMNDLRAEGMVLHEAVVRASKIRLRPILMTAFTTVFGLMPLSLGIGEGAQLQAPMARVIMGGIITSTFLTLVVIPVLYLASEQIKSKMKTRRMNLSELLSKS